MARHKRCEVLWLDAHDATTEAWHDLDEPFDPAPVAVLTRGWLLEHAKEGHVVVAGSLTSDETVSHVTCIPVGMVKVLETY